MTALYFAHLDAAGPGQRQAARVAGLPRHPVPARQPRPVATCRRCAPAAGCSPTRRRTKDPDRWTSPPARSGWARRRRCSPRPPAATSTRTSAPRPRSPVRRADRRRRAGRGQHLGGGLRPGHRTAWATSMWVVDFNRQSLDRVVPGVRIAQWTRPVRRRPAGTSSRSSTADALQAAFARPGGAALRAWIDAMPNEQYQSLFGLAGDDAARARSSTARRTAVARVLARASPTTSCAPLVTDLGGHDLARAARRLRRSATRRRTGRAWSSPTP